MQLESALHKGAGSNRLARSRVASLLHLESGRVDVKLIRRTAPTPQEGGGRSRPQWLKEWLANQGRFVLLECGCKDDVNIPYTIMLAFEGKVQVMCDKHGFQNIKRKISLNEFAGIAAKSVPSDPLF